MQGSTFSERLALLPKVNTEERTLVHVQGQKPYAKSYAIEGRRYLLSWQGEYQHGDPPSGEEEKHPADVDLGTPILKPRVEKLAETIPAKSSKIDGRNKNTNTVIFIKTSDSDKDRHQQRKGKCKKPADTAKKVDKSKEKSTSSQKKKKRVNECTSDTSSRLERLKDRRERKRAKRVVVEAPKSDKENDAEEGRETRKKSKKIPAGFALMHGFVATNVGKGRLTVKPPATMGVFNKGKASRRTNTVKSKGSRKNSQREDCFSESKFLNKSEREDGPPDRSSSGSSDTSVSSGGIVTCGPSKREKIMENVPDLFEVKSATSTKKPESSSIISSTEHANPSSASVASYKQGSIILDTTRHVWANVMCIESDGEKKGTAAGSQENCGIPLSIAPSQSASQCIIMPTDRLDGNRSRYFPSRDQPTIQALDMTKEPLASLCSFEGESSDDVARVSMEDQVILPENACTQNNQVSQLMEFAYNDITYTQPEYDERMLIDLHLLQPDGLDGDTSERCADYLSCCQFDDVDNDEHRDLQNDEILDQNRFNEAFFMDENNDAEECNLELTAEDDLYDYCQTEDMQDRDNAGSSDEPHFVQVDRFYQGRAMLLGCTEHESGSNYLASAEVDVVKRLRDHWHPRRL